MENKIKLYSIVLAIAYFGMLIFSIYQGADDFMAGFKLGRQGKATNWEIHNVKVKPTAGNYSYPEALKNLKNGQVINAEAKEFVISMPVSSSEHSTMSSTVKILQLIFAFVFLFIFIRIPILFFTIIRSILKGSILDKKTIKQIATIAWLLIGYYALSLLLYNIGEVCISQQLLQLENYEIISDYSDTTVLILGMVTLLFAEILKLSLRMKEEQDLTI